MTTTEIGWRIVPYAVFLAVPWAFWWLLTRVLQPGRERTWSAVVTGGDGRLSLSRMQAFAWTLIILGSYCAAMAVRRPFVVIADKTEVAALEADLKAKKTKADDAAVALGEAEVDLVRKKAEAEAADKMYRGKPAHDAARAAKEAADKTLAAAEAELKRLTDAKSNTDAAVKARDAAMTEQAARKAEVDRYDAELAAVNTAKAALRTAASNVDVLKQVAAGAEGKRNEAHKAFRRTHWVRIPLELLALAGISLATGVFAAAISASGDTGVPPVVGGITAGTDKPADAAPTTSTSFLTITGSGFGKSGDVRLNRRYVRWIKWTETEIVVETKADAKYETLTVDTPNGKVSYELNDGKLGNPIVIHESADLFREDNNPRIFSMTKFQMFAWTIVAIVFYIVVLFANLNEKIDMLPVVDATLVLLTGLSAGGYLGGKAASNMNPPK